MSLRVYLQLKVENSPAGITGFTDITSRVALEKASWSQDADGMSSDIKFPIFTILPQSSLDWSEYPGNTSAIKFAAAISDQNYRLDIPIRSEFYIEDTETNKRVFGGVITSVDYGQESGYLIANITGGDYTQIIEEWVVNQYDIPYASRDTDIIVGNITPNAYTGVATSSLFSSKNLARNIESGSETPSINPIFYTVTNIRKSGLGSYSPSAVSSIVTTEEDHDFEAGQQAIISGTVITSSTQENEVFDCTGNVTHVISNKTFVVASFPVSPASVVSASAITDYPQETAIVRHDYIISASDTLFSPVYSGYGTAFNIENIRRSGESGRISIEVSAPATATIEMVPADGYYYAVKEITKAVGPYTNITADNLAVAIIDADPNEAAGRTDVAQMSLRRIISQVEKKNNALEITLQAATSIEARVDTLCYIRAYIYKKDGDSNKSGATKDITGVYKVVALANGNNKFSVTPVGGSISEISDQVWSTVDISKGKGKTVTVTKKKKKYTYTPGDGKDPVVDSGIAITAGDNWVITGDIPDAGITATAIVATPDAISVSGISKSRSVFNGTYSYIEYFAYGDSYASFSAGDYVNVFSYTPAYVTSDAIVEVVNPTANIISATAATTAVVAANVTKATYFNYTSGGQMRIDYNDADPGFIAGDFVNIYSIPSNSISTDYKTSFAKIVSVQSETQNIIDYVGAQSAFTITNFDTGKIVSVDSARAINAIEMFYNGAASSISVNNYVSITASSVVNVTSGIPISINSAVARVVGTYRTNVTVSSAVAKTGAPSVSDKLHAIVETGRGNSGNDIYLKYYFDPGTTLGVVAGDIVNISGVVDSISATFAYYNRSNVNVVEVGSTTFGGGGAVTPAGTYPWIKILKPAISSGSAITYVPKPRNPERATGNIIAFNTDSAVIAGVDFVTYVTSQSHVFSPGQIPLVGSMSDAAFNINSDVIFDVNVSSANSFRIIKTLSGSASGPGTARLARNSVTVLIPNSLNLGTTGNEITIGSATITRIRTNIFKTESVNKYNVGDSVSVENVTTNPVDQIQFFDKKIIALENENGGAISYASNGTGNRFVVIDTANATYVSGGYSYVSRIKSNVFLEWKNSNVAGRDFSGIAAYIARVPTVTYTVDDGNKMAILAGDNIVITGTTNYNIAAGTVDYKNSSTQFTLKVENLDGSGTGSFTAGIVSYVDDVIKLKYSASPIANGPASTAATISRVPVTRYTIPNHNFMPGQEVTISGMVPSDYNVTSQEVFKILDSGASKKIVIKDIEYIANGAGAVTTYGSAAYPYPDNNGSFVLAASPGFDSSGNPFVVYVNDGAVPGLTSASTRAASTRIKLEYSYNVRHGLSESKTKNGIRVGDSVKIYGKIKSGSVQSIVYSGNKVTAYSVGSLGGLSVGDKIKISGAGNIHDGYFFVESIGSITRDGIGYDTFSYTNSRLSGNGSFSHTPNPSWAVMFDNAADQSSAIAIETVARDIGGIVTITTDGDHGLSVGQRVNISISKNIDGGGELDQISGTQIVLTVPETNEITYQTLYEDEEIEIVYVLGFIYPRDGYSIYSVPNESTAYIRWNGTQSVKARSVTASIDPRLGVSDVVIVSDTANIDVDGQYRIVELDGPDYFGDTTPSAGYFEAVPTGESGTSEIEFSGQGVFQKKQELSVGKRLEPINGRTLRSALDTITARTKGQFWVDPYKNLHYQRRRIENLISSPIYESTNGSASSSGWDLGNDFMLDRSGTSGPYGFGYTVFTTGTSTMWQYVKFVPKLSRTGGHAVTISKIKFYSDGDLITSVDAYSNYNESVTNKPENLISDNLSQYWSTVKINTIDSSGNPIAAPYVVIEFDSPTTVNSYSIVSGVISSAYDPTSWEIYGSSDAADWTIIDTKYQYTFPTRRKTSTEQITISSGFDASFSNSDGISVYPGKKYWVSARVKTSLINSSYIKIGFAESDGGAVGNYTVVDGPNILNEWRKIYSIVEVPSGKYKMYVYGVVDSAISETHYTDWIATEITGSYGFSDQPAYDESEFNNVIDLYEYEIPDYSKESAGIANTVYIYAAIMRPEDSSSENVLAVSDGRRDLTNTLDNGQIDYDEKSANISYVQKVSQVVTITTSSTHGFIENDYVYISINSDANNINFNGIHKITSASSLTFTYEMSGANVSTRRINSGEATSDHSIRNWSAENGTIFASTDYEFVGSHSILVTPDSIGNVDVIYSEGSSISIRQGDSYTFSVKAFSPAGQTSRSYDIYLYYYGTGSNPQIVGETSALNVSDLPGSWKTISVSGVAPTNAAYATFKITIKDCDVEDLHYFDDAAFVDVSYQQIYSYSFTDTKAIWNASGKIIESAESDSSLATEEEVVIKAKSIFEGNPSGLESIGFSISYNETPPAVGTTVPFFWRNINIADVYVVKSVSTAILGTDMYYKIQITGDSELLGRGLLSGKRSAISISQTVDLGTRTINPVIYPYIRNGIGGGIEINWLHAAGGANVEYAVWARAIPTGSTQYDVARYKIIQSKIPSTSVDRVNGIIEWINGSSYSDGTINRSGKYNYKDFDIRYSYQFIIRASIVGEEVYSPAAYIPEPGSPISSYIIPPNVTTLQTISPMNISQDDYSQYVRSGLSEGFASGMRSIQAVGSDGGDAPVFTIDGRGITVYNATEYTDGLGITHDAGTRTIIESNLDTGVTINADVINTGVINANVVDVINLNADNIVAGTIDASQIEVINLNADNITSGTIAATELRVGSGSDTVGITADYLSGSAGYAFWAGSEDPSSSSPFSIQTDGSVIASNITIVGGSLDASVVSVTNLNADNITSGTISADQISTGTITSVAINAGSGTFQVSSNGNMTATSASITGTISATAGNIGGWTINGASITGGDVTLSSSGSVIVGSESINAIDNISTESGAIGYNAIYIDGNKGIWAGDIDIDSAPFSVGLDGRIRANAASFTDIDVRSIKMMGAVQFGADDTDGISSIKVYNSSSVQVAQWDETGIQISDEGIGSSKRIQITGGQISIFDSDGNELAAITGSGINASSITVGAMPGGTNRIPNSSFELTTFASNAAAPATIDSDADFNTNFRATGVTNVNVTITGGAITMTSFGY
jgi:hypothetical protein